MIARVRRKALASLAIAAVLAVTGCGGGSKPPPPGTPSAAEFLVESPEIAKQPKGSPQEGLMVWWRAIQYNDFNGYLEALSAPLRRKLEGDRQVREELSLVAGEATHSQPQVVNVQRSGDKATVFSRVETRTPVGATRFTTSSYPQAFSLVHEGDSWKIADDFYLNSRYKAIKKAERENEGK